MTTDEYGPADIRLLQLALAAPVPAAPEGPMMLPVAAGIYMQARAAFAAGDDEVLRMHQDHLMRAVVDAVLRQDGTALNLARFAAMTNEIGR
jgi:hypothetical protein